LVYDSGAEYTLVQQLTYPVNGSDGKPVYIIGGSVARIINLQETTYGS
jgi:hypothetical protein